MATRRTLVLVAGSGRSGASLVAGVLQRLGFTVPVPEVPADDAHPRGFGESQWVVDFHTKLLERANVQVADGRPAAWAQTADAGLDNEVEEQLRGWLAAQFKQTGDIVIKDPRLMWFVPLWRRCGASIDAAPRFILPLRHPAAVAEDTWPGDVSRTAAWLNQTLFTERATRDATRAFVGYDELVADWTVAIGRLGEELDLEVVRSAAPPAMRRVHDFLDGVPGASRTEWGDTRIPASLTELAGQTWEHISGERPPEALDAARRSYIELYEQAEAIAHSSVAGSRRRQQRQRQRPKGTAVGARPATKAARMVPRGVRRRVPVRWRRRVLGVLGRSRSTSGIGRVSNRRPAE